MHTLSIALMWVKAHNYVWGSNSPSNHICLLNGDDTEQISPYISLGPGILRERCRTSYSHSRKRKKNKKDRVPFCSFLLLVFIWTELQTLVEWMIESIASHSRSYCPSHSFHRPFFAFFRVGSHHPLSRVCLEIMLHFFCGLGGRVCWALQSQVVLESRKENCTRGESMLCISCFGVSGWTNPATVP